MALRVIDDHFNTDEGWPQTRAEVEAMTNDQLDDFMAMCDVEPADFDGCLACYAYEVAQDREALAKVSNPTSAHIGSSSEARDNRIQ